MTRLDQHCLEKRCDRLTVDIPSDATELRYPGLEAQRVTRSQRIRAGTAPPGDDKQIAPIQGWEVIGGL